ncbi:MAG: alpha/beta fold hydrolase [Pseudomonadota bacterium]
MTCLTFLHAVTRDRADFDPFIAVLPPELKASAVDLPGHGSAQRLHAYTLPSIASAVDPQKGERNILWGHSLGGLVALWVGAHRPQSIAALVLEDPPLFDAMQPRLETTHWARGFRALHAIMVGRAAAWTVSDWETAVADWPCGNGTATIAEAGGPEAVARRAKQIAALDPAVPIAMVAPEFSAGIDPLALIRRISIPIVILAGERSLGSALSADDLQVLGAEHNVAIVPAEGAGHQIREARAQLAVQTLLSVV